jgi:hypothetical protein
MSEQIDVVINKCMTVLDSARLFYRSKWSQVKEGDVILVGEHAHIEEARVVEIADYNFDGLERFKITLSPSGSQRRYVSVCWPGDTVYIQSRF